MVPASSRNLTRAPRSHRATLLTALLLPGLLMALPACPAQVAWEEGQRNQCRLQKQLARRCWSYGVLSNLQCQTEEEEEKRRLSLGDTTPVDSSPIRLTSLTCDRELLATYLYCDGLISEGCRFKESSSGSSSSSESSSSSSSSLSSRPGHTRASSSGSGTTR